MLRLVKVIRDMVPPYLWRVYWKSCIAAVFAYGLSELCDWMKAPMWVEVVLLIFACIVAFIPIGVGVQLCRVIRKKKSPCCWECMYDLSMIPSDVCPECGFPIAESHRRWVKFTGKHKYFRAGWLR